MLYLARPILSQNGFYVALPKRVTLDEHGWVTSGERRGSKVSEWLARYEAHGAEGLLEGYRSGRPARLTEAQHRRLGDILDSGPVAYGLDTGIWTSPMIAWVMEEEFGVVYHPGHVRKLLHDLGFSVQRPRRVLARADRHQQDRWHRYLYPRLKKKPAPRTEH